MSDFLRGAARGLTADLVGGPVDLATTATNLGIAGTGYLAHKLRLIKQPPELIDAKNVPFSSDWFAKNTPLQDTGTEGYVRGRLAVAITPAIAGMLRNVRPRHGQTNALYPGGSDDYLLSHGTNEDNLIDSPHELYNPSLAITKNKIPDDFGDVSLIFNPRHFEPRTSTTVIKNRDFYSPRFGSSRAGGSFDEALAKDIKAKNQVRYSNMIREMAGKRVADRFLPTFAHSGSFSEGVIPPDTSRLPRFRQRYSVDPIDPISDTGYSAFTRAVVDSPRFQSFKHFEQSPHGAKLLNSPGGIYRDPKVVTQDIEGKLEKIIGNIRWLDDAGNVTWFNDPTGRNMYRLLDKLVAADTGGLDTSKMLNKNLDPMSPEQATALISSLRGLRKDIRSVPSEYAEVKRFGYVPLNKETVAMILAPDRKAAEKLQQFSDRGIPVAVKREMGDTQLEIFKSAVREQNRVMDRYRDVPTMMPDGSITWKREPK